MNCPEFPDLKYPLDGNSNSEDIITYMSWLQSAFEQYTNDPVAPLGAHSTLEDLIKRINDMYAFLRGDVHRRYTPGGAIAAFDSEGSRLTVKHLIQKDRPGVSYGPVDVTECGEAAVEEGSEWIIVGKAEWED